MTHSDLQSTIDELSQTTIFSAQEIATIAKEYPDASFLRFAVAYWASGVRLSLDQMAKVYYAPPRAEQ